MAAITPKQSIGDAIDSSCSNDWENVLLTIKERKSKKKACDIDTLREECKVKYKMDDICFDKAKLTTMDCIKNY